MVSRQHRSLCNSRSNPAPSKLKIFWVWTSSAMSQTVTCVYCCLTGLVGGDVDSGELRWEGTLVRHSIHSLDLKGVLRVGQQVTDVDPGISQAQLAGQELHIVTTASAGSSTRTTALADDVKDHVLPASALFRWIPLQPQGSLVHARNHSLGCRRNHCGKSNHTASSASPRFIGTGV